MRLTADYHTHTVFSHGTGTVEQNAQAALAQGLTTLAITDHGPRHLFGMRAGRLSAYWKEIDRVAKKYPSLRLLCGAELNILNNRGATDLPLSRRDYFDILLLGWHEAIVPTPRGMLPWAMAVARDRAHLVSKTVLRRNTDAVLFALDKLSPFALVHPGRSRPVETERLARECAARGVLLELNASSHTPRGDIPQMAAAGARFIASSDAHSPREVGKAEWALRQVEQYQLAAITENVQP